MNPNADIFIEAFNLAQEHGLEAEFVSSFFDMLRLDDDMIGGAIDDALYEWDI